MHTGIWEGVAGGMCYQAVVKVTAEVCQMPSSSRLVRMLYMCM